MNPLRTGIIGCGIFVNWGSYDLDFLMSITNWELEPESVLARSWPVSSSLESYVASGSNAETHITAMLACSNGTVINYERAELACAARETAWNIIGDKGALRMQMVPNGNNPALVFDKLTAKGVVSEVILKQDLSFAKQHRRINEDFASAVREDREPNTNLKRSMILQKVRDSAYKSIAQNKTVYINDK